MPLSPSIYTAVHVRRAGRHVHRRRHGSISVLFIFVRWGKGMGSHGGVRVASRTHGEYPRPLDPIRWPGSTAHQARYGGGVIVRHSSARMPRCGSTSRSTPEATRTPVPGRQQRPDHASSHHRHGGSGARANTIQSRPPTWRGAVHLAGTRRRNKIG